MNPQMNQSSQMNAQPNQLQGEQLAAKIRELALQGLNSQEIQVLQQSITPQFIQVMGKLIGDPALVILTPLANLQQDFVPQENAAQTQQNPLNQFSASPSPVRFGQGR